MNQGGTQHTWLLTGTALLDRSARLPHTSRRPVKRLKHTYRRNVYSQECKLLWELQVAGADWPMRCDADQGGRTSYRLSLWSRSCRLGCQRLGSRQLRFRRVELQARPQLCTARITRIRGACESGWSGRCKNTHVRCRMKLRIHGVLSTYSLPPPAIKQPA